MINNAQRYTKDAYSKTQLGIIENIFDHEKESLDTLLQDYAVWDDMYYGVEEYKYSWSRANATEFLVTDQSGYDIDIVHVVGIKNDYNESYGDKDILAQIMALDKFSETIENHGVWSDYIAINRRVFLVAMSPITTNNKKMSNGFFFIAKEYTNKEIDQLVSRYSNKTEYSGLINVPTKGDGTTSVNYSLTSEDEKVVMNYTFHYNLEGYYKSYDSLLVHTLTIVLTMILAVMLGINQIRKKVYRSKDEVIRRLERLGQGETDEIIGAEEFKEVEEVMAHINSLAIKMKTRDKMNMSHHIDTLTVIIDAIEEKDEFTKGHSRRVMKISEIIGRHMKVEDIKLLKESALLHDIGKISLPGKILNKPGTLTDEEYELVKSHVNRGECIVKGIPYLEDIGVVIRQHHEKVDGSGYPNGIKGENIDLFARIISLADSFDAMISDRAYRKKMEFYQAVLVIKKEAGIHFDESTVSAFLESLHEIRLVVFQEEEMIEN